MSDNIFNIASGLASKYYTSTVLPAVSSFQQTFHDHIKPPATPSEKALDKKVQETAYSALLCVGAGAGVWTACHGISFAATVLGSCGTLITLAGIGTLVLSHLEGKKDLNHEMFDFISKSLAPGASPSTEETPATEPAKEKTSFEKAAARASAFYTSTLSPTLKSLQGKAHLYMEPTGKPHSETSKKEESQRIKELAFAALLCGIGGGAVWGSCKVIALTAGFFGSLAGFVALAGIVTLVGAHFFSNDPNHELFEYFANLTKPSEV